MKQTVLAFLCFGLHACSAPAVRATELQPLTEVFVMGMIHSGHRTSTTWGLAQVRATLEALDPDLICAEIPPANWPSTQATWKAKGIVDDSRVRVFPEYVDVLMPLTDVMDFEVVPCAGWTPEMAEARAIRLKQFEVSDADAEAREPFEADDEWVTQWLDSQPAGGADDDPFYIHSPAYDLRTKAELGPYEFYLNDVIGAPGGWTYINQEHFALVRAAIESHPGERIVVTFGAGHKYWFLEQLRAMPGVRLGDVRDFLPSASGAQAAEQRVGDEFLLGLDAMRAHWSASRGTNATSWERIDSMLEGSGQAKLLARLVATRGNQASEFKQGPFIGPVRLGQQDTGIWTARVKIWRLGAALDDWQEASAELLPDATRPGGYAWRKLSLPSWLLALPERR